MQNAFGPPVDAGKPDVKPVGTDKKAAVKAWRVVLQRVQHKVEPKDAKQVPPLKPAPKLPKLCQHVKLQNRLKPFLLPMKPVVPQHKPRVKPP